jgi:mannose-1-phosphate guanylyltransferase
MPKPATATSVPDQTVGSRGQVIEAFVEKPDLETARRYYESGQYLWNGGMFCFQAPGDPGGA